MGEPGDDKLYAKRAAAPELVERNPKSDPPMVKQDSNVYRSFVISRLDHIIDRQDELIEAIKENTKATALLAKELQKNGSKGAKEAPSK